MQANVDVLILGAGLTGLAAASLLGERARVLERDAAPGGMARSLCYDGYWFDRAPHLLHFADAESERRVRDLLGGALRPCSAEAWIETAAGRTRYPFQLHLRGLDQESRLRCILDLHRAIRDSSGRAPASYQEMLERTFGAAMCELFFLPYNRKLWKRPLDRLAPSGFTGSLRHPAFEEALRGAFTEADEVEDDHPGGWYPHPPAGAPVRGMGVLSQALAAQVPNLDLGTNIESIDLRSRTLVARRGSEICRSRYRAACLSTLPLNRVLRICKPLPPELVALPEQMAYNNLYSVAFCVRGPRPRETGLWRYYTDETLPFTRLIFPHAFDPLMAPEDGFGVMAEVPHPAEQPPLDAEALVDACREGLARAGVLAAGSQILSAHSLRCEPAHLVASTGLESKLQAARNILASHGVRVLGHYGRWKYASMAQVIAEGWRWAEGIAESDWVKPER